MAEDNGTNERRSESYNGSKREILRKTATVTDYRDNRPGNRSSSDSKSTRRQTLKSIVGAAAGISLGTGFVQSARAQEEKVGLEELGLADEYEKLLRQGKVDDAEALLQSNGVAYSRDSVPVGVKQSDESGGITASPDMYGKAESSVDLVATYNYGDLWRTSLNPALHVVDIYDAGDPDGMGISFSSDLWEFEPGTESLGTYTSNFDPNPEGVIAEFDEVNAHLNDTPPRDVQYPYFRVDLEKTESGAHNIYGHYSHTWCPVVCGGASFSISAGFLSVGTGTGTERWKKPSNTVEV